MATVAELDTRIADLEAAISTVAAGRHAQWGDRVVTMENLPNLQAALESAKRERSNMRRHASGDRSPTRYRLASFR